MSQLPPYNPNDPRNQTGGYPPPNPYPQQPNQGYPPPNPAYPPQVPQTGPLNPYPPQPNQSYPPPNQGYPPASAPYQQPAPLPPYQGGLPLNTPSLAPAPTPSLNTDKDDPVKQFTGMFNERRIEYLAWGLVVLLTGIGIILLAINTEAARSLLLVPGPLAVGGILLFSGFLQRIVFGYNVSILTWGVAVGAISFGLTQLIAMITELEDTTMNMVLYFFGILVVLSGMVIIMQVFRRPHE